VVTGRILHGRLLTHIVLQCGACSDAVGVVVAAGVDLRFNYAPRYHNNLRRGRRPRRPLFGLPPHFASEHCTLLCGCGGCGRLSPRFARRDTQGCGFRTARGALALRQPTMETIAERGGQSARTLRQQPTHILAAQHSAGAGQREAAKLAPITNTATCAAGLTLTPE
jgi:hypothetical protein